MTRLRILLGRSEVHIAGSIAFVLLITWPLWTSARPTTTLLVIFSVWIAFSIFSIATLLLGREPEDSVIEDVDDEGGPT